VARIVVRACLEARTFDNPLTGLNWQPEKWT